MIKFFRKIRQQLVAEKRLGQYLLYALGEFILVVFGYPDCLTDQNKNAIHKSGQKEMTLRSEMKANLKNDLHQYEVVRTFG